MSQAKGKPSRKAVVWDANHVLGLDNEKAVCCELTESQISFLLTPLVAAQWRTRWINADGYTHDEIQQFVADVQAALLDAQCAAMGEGTDESESGNMGALEAFDDLIESMVNAMPKFRIDGELYEPVIDLVKCGCGDGASSTGGVGADGGVSKGGTEGGWDNLTTLCDLITGIAGLLTRVEDFNDALANARLATDAIVPDEYVSLVDKIISSFNETDAVLQDASFIRLARKKAAQTLPDPLPSSGLTRQMLRDWARAMPLLYEAAPIWAVFTVWAEIANVREINLWLPDVAGTADSAICQEAFSGTGRTPYTPPNTAPDLIVVDGGNYGVIEVFSASQQVAVGNSVDLITSGGNVDNFVGYIAHVSGLGSGVSANSLFYFNVTYGGNSYTNSHKVHEPSDANVLCSNDSGLVNQLQLDGYFSEVSSFGTKGAFTADINDNVNNNLPDTITDFSSSASNSNNSSGAYTVEKIWIVVKL